MAGQNIQQILISDNSNDCSNDLSMAVQTNESHLLIIEDDQGRKELILENSLYSIGRDRNCNIRLISQFVSRRHATLVKRSQQDNQHKYYYQIVDGDGKGKVSANGLMINGRKVATHDLKNEDEIVFGPQVRAVYYVLKEDSLPSIYTDISEYDITLINPAMNDEFED
ncbi:MAG: FHA domain-containing protein [Nostocaceae cyanobacterium]|nr:FHA domain-containing protein [Nostocaceae cyanobacterium]